MSAPVGLGGLPVAFNSQSVPAYCRDACAGSVFVWQHDREARFATITEMGNGLERVEASPTCAGDNYLEEAVTGHRWYGRHSRHVEDIMPNALPVVAVFWAGDGLFNQCRHSSGHGDMHAGEVLGGDGAKVTGRGIDEDAVGEGLGTDISGNDHEPVKGMAGLVDNVAGLGSRMAGDVAHGIWDSCAPTRAREQRAALRGPRRSQTLKRPPRRDAAGQRRPRKVEPRAARTTLRRGRAECVARSPPAVAGANLRQLTGMAPASKKLRPCTFKEMLDDSYGQ